MSSTLSTLSDTCHGHAIALNGIMLSTLSTLLGTCWPWKRNQGHAEFKERMELKEVWNTMLSSCWSQLRLCQAYTELMGCPVKSKQSNCLECRAVSQKHSEWKNYTAMKIECTKDPLPVILSTWWALLWSPGVFFQDHDKCSGNNRAMVRTFSPSNCWLNPALSI